MKIFLFDIDGTLIATGGAGKQAFAAALRQQFAVDPDADGVPFSGRTDRAIVQDFFRRHQIDETPGAWQRFSSAYLTHLPEKLAGNRGRVLPGVVSLLDACRARADVALGLLTGNIAEGARLKLAHYGLGDYFSFGGFGDQHADRADVAREALAAARSSLALDLPAEDVVVIGDTPLDVQCAREIGAQAIAVCTGFHDAAELSRANPDLLLDDLSDPAPLLR